MATDYHASVLIGGYEKITIDGIIKTYDMLADLDEVMNDEELSEVVNRIKIYYLDIEESMKNYFDLVKRTGGTVKNSSLVHEFEHGLYCLDEKYRLIVQIVEQFS